MCGLAAFVPKTSKTGINLLAFKSLLIYNEERGKQSTGLWNNNSGVIKDIIKAQEFTQNVNWRKLNRKSVFLGHTRQPTFGYPVTMKGAQPIEFGNIVMVHNGTIYNKLDLAKKYGVKAEHDDTDSIILAKILEKKEFGVLEDYRGAAALMFVYLDDPNTMYFYKGASKRAEDAKDIFIERPLHVVEMKEGLYFASLKEQLENVTLDDKELEAIEEVPHNKVFTISIGDNCEIKHVMDIERKQLQTDKLLRKDQPVQLRLKKHSGSGLKKLSGGNKNHLNDKGTLADMINRRYNIYDEDCYDDCNNHSPALKDKDITNIDSIDDLDEYNEKYKAIVFEKLMTVDTHSGDGFFNPLEDGQIQNEEVDLDLMERNKVYYNKGRYWYANIPANGHLRLNEEGYPDANAKQYTFIQGILVDDDVNLSYQDFSYLLRELELEFGNEDFALELSQYSDQPIPYYVDDYCNLVFCKRELAEYHGEYEPLFYNRGTYIFNYGFLYDIDLTDDEVSNQSKLDFNKSVIVLPSGTDPGETNKLGIAVGDIVTNVDDLNILVTELFTYHFDGIELISNDENMFRYSNVKCIKTKRAQLDDDEAYADFLDRLYRDEDVDDTNNDDELPFGEIETEEESLKVRDVALEFMDSCSDTIKQLQQFQGNQSAEILIEDISKFIENKLVI